MIKITKTIEVSSTNFTHTWIIPECANLISSTVEGNIITAYFDYCDANCLLNYETVTLIVVDSDGCKTEQEIFVNNICEDFAFTNGGITEALDCDDCNLKLTAPTNEPNVTYVWNYDTSVLQGTIDGNTIEFEYVLGSNFKGGNFPVSLTAINQYGCELKDSYIFDICYYEGGSFTYTMSCILDNNFEKKLSTGSMIPFTEICGQPVNWATFQFNRDRIFNIPGFTIDIQSTGIVVELPEVTTSTTYKINGSIADCKGFRSPIQFCMIANPCPEEPIINSLTINYGCDSCDETTKAKVSNLGRTDKSNTCKGPTTIDLDSYIIGNPTWSTFSFIPNTNQTLISPTEMSTPYGSVSLNLDRDLFINYLNGIQATEFINYSVEINGVNTVGEIILRTGTCSDNPIAVNDSFCMLTEETSEFINFTLNDSGIFDKLVIVDYPSIQVTQRDLSLRFTSNSTSTNTLLKYKLVNTVTNQESNVAIIDINVNSSNFIFTDKSICLGEEIDLNTLINDTNPNWTFAGYTTDYSNIPGTLNSNQYNVGDVINFTVLNLTQPGVYTFINGDPTDPCIMDVAVNIEVVLNQGLTDIITDVCITDSPYDLNTLANVTDGNWTYISPTPINNFDGVLFNAEVIGDYQFRWNRDNIGLYNTLSCDSTLILNLGVKPEPTIIEPICLIYCSYGPDVTEDPDCRNKVVSPLLPTTGCVFDLYNEIQAPAGSTIQLLSAPYLPIRLTFNGVSKLYNQLDYLPQGIALWDNGKAPLGSYEFRVTYGDPCTKIVDIEANIYKAVCSLDVTTINVCFEGPTFNIFNVITNNSNCLQGSDVALTLISENLAGQGTSTYNITTGEFSPTVPGEWVFTFTAGLIGADPDCEACSVNEEIRIIVHPLPGPGIPNPGAVCNDGTCTVPVYPGMFNPNQSILGTFCYDGFATTTTGTPDVGGWGGVEPTLNPGDVSGPSYSFEGALQGFYFFSNKVTDENGCTSMSQTIVQVVQSLVAGTGSTVDSCELTPECFILRDLITGETAGGNWIQTEGTTTNAFNNCDPGIWIAADEATFNTAGQPVGTYKFKYVTTSSPAIYPLYDGCVACAGSEAEVIINITPAILAGNGSSQAVCA